MCNNRLFSMNLTFWLEFCLLMCFLVGADKKQYNSLFIEQNVLSSLSNSV